MLLKLILLNAAIVSLASSSKTVVHAGIKCLPLRMETALPMTVASILVICLLVYVSALNLHVTAPFISFKRRRPGHNFGCVATNKEVTCLSLHFVLLSKL